MDAESRVELLLALADDELVLGHRHVQWTGVAPHLEEDLAFTSIGLDEIGHAVIWYQLAAELTGQDPDELSLGRPPERWRSCTLVERPNRDWAYTVVRQWLYDLAERERLEALACSSWPALAAATAAPLREERWHRRHAEQWMARMAGGHAEARQRLADALRLALPEAASLFAPVAGEARLLADGVLAEPSPAIRERWAARVAGELRGWGQGELVALLGGEAMDRAERTADFAEVWEELTGLHRAYPGAQW